MVLLKVLLPPSYKNNAFRIKLNNIRIELKKLHSLQAINLPNDCNVYSRSCANVRKNIINYPFDCYFSIAFASLKLDN